MLLLQDTSDQKISNLYKLAYELILGTEKFSPRFIAPRLLYNFDRLGEGFYLKEKNN